MRVAVMQPYLFPYIGYFQLLMAADHFVFYDDVNYIKGGWINRNRILLNGTDHLFTLPLTKPSPNKRINEIELGYNDVYIRKFLFQLEMAYKKAPHFKPVHSLVEKVLRDRGNSIGELASNSVKEISNYLGVSKNFHTSSIDFADTLGMDRSDRLIQICKRLESKTYINPEGGSALYTKERFSLDGISLHFLKAGKDVYPQFKNEFVPWLSIIDALMFNDPEQVVKMMENFELC